MFRKGERSPFLAPFTSAGSRTTTATHAGVDFIATKPVGQPNRNALFTYDELWRPFQPNVRMAAPARPGALWAGGSGGDDATRKGAIPTAHNHSK